MKDRRPRPSSALLPSKYATKFNALATFEREQGTFRVRCLLQWLTRPRTFVLMTLFLLLAPPLWFSSRRATLSPPLAVKPEERRRTQPRAPILFTAEGVKETNTEERATGTPRAPLPPGPFARTSEKKKNRGHGGRREDNKSSPWKPPALPVEVFRDVPPEECLRSPLWDKEVDPSEYEFGCEEINALLVGEKELIGNGVIRDVYKVEHEGRKLVVKALRDDFELRASKVRTDKIHRWEAAALDAIRGHPHLVDMLGTCGASSVSEHFDVRLDDLVLGPEAKPLPISLVVSMALDAARGLQALHEAPGGAIVHFDIKPQQMMLDENGKIKINDLNMLHFTDADVDGNTCPFTSRASRVGPFRSPENIAGENLTEKVDIYSMAMVYYCMLALHPPYTNVPDGQTMIKNGVPPPTDPSWHDGFLAIVRDMWQRDPKDRPSARRVVQRLEILEKQLAMAIA